MALLPAIILYSTLVPLGLFVLYFGLRSSWYTSKTGRMIMGLAVGMVALLLVGLLYRVFDPSFIFTIRVIVYSALHIGVWRLFFTLRSIQRTNCDGTREPMDVQRLWWTVTRRRKKKDR